MSRILSGTNLKLARDQNMRVVLQSVRVHGPVSRPELAQFTGLTPQAVTYMCRELLEAGLIHETGLRRGGRGQPATELSVNPDGGYSIGVNVDRDHLTVLLLDFGGNVRGRVHWEERFLPPEETLARVEHAFTNLLAESGLAMDDLVGVGLAVPYRIGYLRSSITPSSYATWRDYPIGERLAKLTDLTVYVENDASTAAFGEIHYGLGTRFRNFFYVFLGIGLGGSLVVNGDYVPGASGHGGEIGFIPALNGSGTLDTTRTIQADVSLGALYAHLARTGIEVSDPEALAALHAAGEPEITAWIEKAANGLLASLLTIICAIGPEAVVIGGRMPKPLIGDLIEAIEDRIRPHQSQLPGTTPIATTACSTDAAALGAAILPFADLFLPRLGDRATRIAA